MPVISDIRDQLGDLTTMQFISTAFTEASALKIKNIRAQFERNMTFYEEISNLYHLLKVSATSLNLKHLDKKKGQTEKLSTLSVAVTSNMRFYGSLNVDTMSEYLKQIKTYETDCLVCGQTGIDYMSSAGSTKPFEKIVFARDVPTNEEVAQVLEHTRKYERVFVYYPKFVTILSQTIGRTDITQSAPTESINQQDLIQFIFEPELNNIIDFFEIQVRSLLFRRVMLEAELSRTAARLLVMSSAEERADTGVREKRMELGKALRTLKNIQLLETFSGMSKWKK